MDIKEYFNQKKFKQSRQKKGGLPVPKNSEEPERKLKNVKDKDLISDERFAVSTIKFSTGTALKIAKKHGYTEE